MVEPELLASFPVEYCRLVVQVYNLMYFAIHP